MKARGRDANSTRSPYQCDWRASRAPSAARHVVAAVLAREPFHEVAIVLAPDPDRVDRDLAEPVPLAHRGEDAVGLYDAPRRRGAVRQEEHGVATRLVELVARAEPGDVERDLERIV